MRWHGVGLAFGAVQIAGLLTAISATATPFPHVYVDETTETTTAVSGLRGTAGSVVRAPGRDAFLVGIGVDEQGGGNEPCLLETHFSRRNAAAFENVVTRWHQDPCDADRSGAYRDAGTSAGGSQPEGPSSLPAIAGISVCTNDRDNRRLKGIRISTARGFDADGRLFDFPYPPGGFERANCAQWHDPVVCPTGTLATGLEIFRHGDGVGGLALRCATAQLVYGGPTTEPPVVAFSIDDARAVNTLVSGVAAAATRVGPALESDQALVTIDIAERGDRPCAVRIGSLHVRNPITADSSVADHGTNDLNRCGSTRPYDDLSVSARFDPAFVAAHGRDLSTLFVSGLRVCMNNAATRVKGIDLEGRQILASQAGVTVRDVPLDAGAKEDELANCAGDDGWRRWVRCPAGMIATALLPHYELGEQPRAISGLALECSPLAMRLRTAAR